MRTTKRMIKGAVAATLVLAMATPALQAEGFEDFQLTKAIPADAFLAIGSRDHAGREFVNKQVERLWEAVRKAHFERDIKRLWRAAEKAKLQPGEELVGFDEKWQHVNDLISAVGWSELGKREFAFAMKQGFPTPDLIFLMMPPADQAKADFEGLFGLMKELAALGENTFQLLDQDDGETLIRKLAMAGAPMSLTLALHDGVIMVAFGTTMPEQVLALLRGEGGECICSTDRFKGAFAQLPPPTDGYVYYDSQLFFNQLRSTIAMALQMAAAGAPAEGEPGYEEFKRWTALPNKIIAAVDLLDYAAAVSRTEGKRTTTEAVAVLRDGAESCELYPVLFNNRPMAEPLKYIPAEASEFSVSTGLDLHALYKAVVKFLKNDIPEGDEVLAQIEALKDAETGPGIDIENDYIAWIGGRFISFKVPGPTPYSSDEFVLMLSVKDAAKAQATLDELLALAEPLLLQQQGAIEPAEIEGVEGFKSVVLPSLMMFGLSKPTLGVRGEWLYLASSPTILETVFAVAAGKAPNISTSERFQQEGLMPTGPVTSVSFTDLTKIGEQLGQILSMVPMIGMMAAQQGQSNPALQALISMAGRAGRVVRKLDFLLSSAGRTTFDGKVLRTTEYINYREPPTRRKPKPATKPSEEQTGPGTDDASGNDMQ